VAPKIFTLNLQPKPLARIQIKSLQIPLLDFLGISKVVTKIQNLFWATFSCLLSPRLAQQPLARWATQNGRMAPAVQHPLSTHAAATNKHQALPSQFSPTSLREMGAREPIAYISAPPTAATSVA